MRLASAARALDAPRPDPLLFARFRGYQGGRRPHSTPKPHENEGRNRRYSLDRGYFGRLARPGRNRPIRPRAGAGGPRGARNGRWERRSAAFNGDPTVKTPCFSGVPRRAHRRAGGGIGVRTGSSRVCGGEWTVVAGGSRTAVERGVGSELGRGAPRALLCEGKLARAPRADRLKLRLAGRGSVDHPAQERAPRARCGRGDVAGRRERPTPLPPKPPAPPTADLPLVSRASAPPPTR